MVAVPVAPVAEPVAVAVGSVRLEELDSRSVDVRRPALVRPPVDRLVPPVSLEFVLLSFPSLERVRDRESAPDDVVLVAFVVLVRFEDARPVELDFVVDLPLVRFADRFVLELRDDRDVLDDPVVSDDRVLPDELVVVVASVLESFASDWSLSDSSSVAQTLGDGIPLVRFET